MNTKTIIAAIIGGVAALILGFVLYGLLLKNIMAGMMGSAKNVMKPDADMIWWAQILGNLIFAYLVAWIFSSWAGINTFAGGSKAGAMMGFLFTTGSDLISYATTNIFTLNGALLDIVSSIVIWAIASGIVGWWLGRSAPATT
jgi:hypothetical protein